MSWQPLHEQAGGDPLGDIPFQNEQHLADDASLDINAYELDEGAFEIDRSHQVLYGSDPVPVQSTPVPPRYDTDQSVLETSSNPFSMAFYRPFFDVTDDVIKKRLFRAIFPLGPTIYSEGEKRNDMYGPFWVTTTVIVFLGIIGNLVKWMRSNSQTSWSSDIGLLSIAAGFLYPFIVLVPIALWFTLNRVGMSISLTELISVYGYSLTIFVPATIAAAIDFTSVQWIVTLAACCMSALIVLRNIEPRLPSDRAWLKNTPILVVLALPHLVLVVFLKMLFFK